MERGFCECSSFLFGRRVADRSALGSYFDALVRAAALYAGDVRPSQVMHLVDISTMTAKKDRVGKIAGVL